MRRIRTLLIAAFFFSLHTALLAYLNSSMLSQFASQKTIGILYIVASVFSLLFVTLAAELIKRYGNKLLIRATLMLSMLLLLGIGLLGSKFVLGLFVLYFSLNAVVLYSFDIFLEHYSKEGETGNIRGLFLTVSNIGWVIAPTASGLIESRFGFGSVYVVAAIAVLITLVVITKSQKHYSDATYRHARARDGLKLFLKNSTFRTVTIANLILQLFFVFMVIYSPLYLQHTVGFSWKTIGFLLSIMLVPFVIVPLPSGRLADKVLGEKELLVGGMLTSAVAALFLAHITVPSFLFFAIVLFVSRVGASLVETMCETYFFKHVTDSEAGAISFYRNMLPTAYIIGPLIGIVVYSIGSYTLVFETAALIMTLGALYVGLKLRDTR